MLVLRNLAEMFIRALAVGLAEQRMRGVYHQCTSRPHPSVTGNAIKRGRTSSLYRGEDGHRAIDRRARQIERGILKPNYFLPRS